MKKGYGKKNMANIRKIGKNPGMFIQHGGENGPPIDLDWGEVGNYGADSGVEQFLQNNEETQGYEELQNQADMDVYEIFAKEQILRDREGKNQRSVKQFTKKLTATYKGRDGFRETKANVERKGERKQFL